MTISHHALYTDLLQDLSSYLDADVVDEKSSAEGTYWPDMTYLQFAALHLAKSFFKKLEDRTSSNADAAALTKFLQSNIQCRDWSLRLESSGDELLIGLFKQEVYRFLNPTPVDSLVNSSEDLLAEARTGPGASIGARGGDFYTKLFASPLSCTSEGLYSCYENYFRLYPEWARAERLRNTHFDDTQVVAGNRLSFVPKNADTSRVICTEPSLNMFFQLGLGQRMERRLKKFFGIDLSVQPDINRDLAQLGSETDGLCTIDLSSASDTVGRRMIHELFPRDFVAWLEFVRSPTVTLPNGDVEELHMISSMGNGFTFPLETIVFSCAVSAAYSANNIRKVRTRVEGTAKSRTLVLGNFGVFGDDIIVEKEASRQVLRLLTLLGFTVNAEKSFLEGPFRESCGGDFFRGRAVRGVYLKSLKTQANRFVAINRLNEWSAVTGISLCRTVSRLMKTVRYLPVPLYENDDAGIKVPYSMIKHLKRDIDTQSILYRRWTTIPKVMRITDAGITVPRGARQRIYNPNGLYLAILRGDVRGGKSGKPDVIGLRLGPLRYHTKEAVCPNWDFLPTVKGKPFIGLARLLTAIWVNTH